MSIFDYMILSFLGISCFGKVNITISDHTEACITIVIIVAIICYTFAVIDRESK